jgi:gamma-tubulin complex component 5
LVDECELPRHLSSVEDLFLMRKGDAMSNFTDVLFAKVCRFAERNKYTN